VTTDDEIFGAALERPPAERTAFLDQACADAAQRERLDELLSLHGAAAGFLRGPAVARDPAVPIEQPGDKINHYKLVQRIGEGGVGVVWMAQQEQPLRRLVALKIIKLGMETQAVVTRFEAERQALALMDHPNIAKIFDAGVTAHGRPYFVMELVRGVRLTDYCDEHRLTTPERLTLFITVCEAVQHAHQKGIIHRDLKPSNILVTENGGTAVPKVIDFGIAKATQGRLGEHTVFTAFEQFIGTPAYMSPEQADMSSLDVDTRSDIYSLGVLLFELLTGRTPFDTKTMLEGGYRDLSRRIREVDPERPSQRLATYDAGVSATVAKARRTAPAQLAHELRGDLDWIVMRCLEKDRARRYESASALALDIRRHLLDEPILARPPSLVYLGQKLFRRHRAATWAAIASALVLVAGGNFSAWQAVRATRAEREQARLRSVEKDLLRRAEEKEHLAHRRAYAADMNLAQQALANDNLGLAISLLDRHRPAAGETDLRGWEWRYLWQATRSEAAGLLARKPHPIASLAVSADQNWLAIGAAEGGDLSVINLRTRQEIPVPAGTGAVRAVFSPAAPLLAISLVEGRDAEAQPRVRLWHAATREVMAEWTAAGPLGFSDDGTILAAGSARQRGTLQRWKMPTGESLAPLTGPAGGLAVISDDLRLVAREVLRNNRGTVQVAATADGRELWNFDVSDEDVTTLAFSRNGRWLAAAGGNTVPLVKVWDLTTGQLHATLTGHRTYITALVFWPDGRTLASASTDQTIRLWDLDRAALKRVLRGHELEARTLALLDDQTLVSGAKDGEVLLWDTAAPAPRRRQRIDGVATWGFLPDGRDVVLVDAEGVVTVRRAPNYDRAEEKLRVGRVDAGFGPPGGGARGNPTPFTAGGRGSGRPAPRVLFATDAALLALSGDDGIVRVYNWQTGRIVREFDLGGAEAAIVGFTPGGARLVLAYAAGAPHRMHIHAFDLAGNAPARSWTVALAGVARFVLSPDGSKVVIRATGGAQSLLHLADGTEQPIPAAASIAGAPNFSPDTRWLALPSGAGWVKIWDTFRHRQAAELTGFVLGVHAAAFSPDGRRLIAGSGGAEAVRVWDSDGFEPLLNLAAEGLRFGAVTFSRDGTTIGARNASAQLYLWTAPSQAEIDAAEAKKTR
jgi:serine/threonine protein kinase/WD40 repeat protein